jgi:ribosomal protein S18 acetylase RimI-like enzyme
MSRCKNTNMKRGYVLKNFDEAWKIYEDSFPEDERRNLYQQTILMENPMYRFKYLYDCGELAGFLTYWNLDGFVYIDHFAISRNLRVKGLGEKALADFLFKQNQDVVLEVEKPENEIAKKRIAFYERLGFFLNKYDYLQPPFSDNKRAVPLLIMSRPSILSRNDFKKIKEILYRDVYSI